MNETRCPECNRTDHHEYWCPVITARARQARSCPACDVPLRVMRLLPAGRGDEPFATAYSEKPRTISSWGLAKDEVTGYVRAGICPKCHAIQYYGVTADIEPADSPKTLPIPASGSSPPDQLPIPSEEHPESLDE